MDGNEYRAPVNLHALVEIFGANVEVLPLCAGDRLYVPSASFHQFLAPDCVRIGTGLVSPSEMTDYSLRQVQWYGRSIPLERIWEQCTSSIDLCACVYVN